MNPDHPDTHPGLELPPEPVTPMPSPWGPEGLSWLSEIRLENFKAFGSPPETIPLAPVTLVYGANSVGKSSIVQVLLALSQSWSRVNGVASLQTEGDLVRLGAYWSVIHKQKLDAPVRIGLATSNHTGSRDRRWDCELEYTSAGARPASGHLNRVWVEQSGLPCFVLSEPSIEELQQHAGLDAGSAALTLSVIPFSQAEPKDERQRTLQRDYLQGLLPWLGVGDAIAIANDPDALLWTDEGKAACRSALGGHTGKLSLADILTLLYVGHGTSLSVRLSVGGVEVDVQASDPGTSQELSRCIDDARSSVKHAVDASVLGARLLLRDVRHIGRVRGVRAEGFVPKSLPPDSVGHNGTECAELLASRPTVLRQVNTWLAAFDLPYELVVEGDERIRYLLLRMHEPLDDAEQVKIGIPHVGSGVAHILPVLAEYAVLCERAETIPRGKPAPCLFVEQPELHLHPRMMDELACILAGLEPVPGQSGQWRRRTARGEGASARLPQVLIETHSEHMVLALLQQIDRGVLPADWVRFVVLGAGGMHLVEPRRVIHGSGSSGWRLDSPWPGGFFPERDELKRP